MLGAWEAEDFATYRGRLATADMLALVAEGAVLLENARAARFLYDHILPVQNWHLQANPMFPLGPAGRTLGNLAVVLGDFDAAERHFETALALDRRMGARGWAPRTQCDYASMLLRRGMPGDRAKALSLLEQATATAQQLGLKGWLDRSIEVRLRAQGVDSGSVGARTSLDMMAASMGVRQPDLTAQSAADGTVTLMFSDVVEFTSMTERLGDLRAREVIREHHRIVREAVRDHGGHELELRGDGFLMAFAGAADGVRCAIAIQRALAEHNRAAQEPIHVRIGLHTGEALRERDKFFGKTVILASRIADASAPDEILVSDPLRRITESSGKLRFGTSRTVRLKGISSEQTLHAVEW
jgi:class 3 adenylate cyclase